MKISWFVLKSFGKVNLYQASSRKRIQEGLWLLSLGSLPPSTELNLETFSEMDGQGKCFLHQAESLHGVHCQVMTSWSLA